MSKVLIIDDAWDKRFLTYSNVLSEGQLTFVGAGRPSDAMSLVVQDDDIDVYIVDIVLDGWDFHTNETPVVHILGKIPQNKPIILVSNEYEELVKKNELTRFINEVIDKGYNVKSFLLWSDFKNAEHDGNAKQAILSKINFYCGLRKKQEYDFAVVCALPDELTPFLHFLQQTEDTLIKGIRAKKGILQTKLGKELKCIAVTQTNMGMVDAAILSTILVSQLEIRHLFMIGVCGGRDNKVSIGSIVIPIEIVAYQNGKITENGLIPNVKIAKCDKSFGTSILASGNYDKILQQVYKDAQNEIRDETRAGIDAKILDMLETNEMACGDAVINAVGKLDEIAKAVGKETKLCAVDMESYSIYRLAELLKVDATVIKTVMDLSSKKSDKYKKYAELISAKFLYYMLYEGVVNL
jgi:nucleoside phosphorylase